MSSEQDIIEQAFIDFSTGKINKDTAIELTKTGNIFEFREQLHSRGLLPYMGTKEEQEKEAAAALPIFMQIADDIRQEEQNKIKELIMDKVEQAYKDYSDGLISKAEALTLTGCDNIFEIREELAKRRLPIYLGQNHDTEEASKFFDNILKNKGYYVDETSSEK